MYYLFIRLAVIGILGMGFVSVGIWPRYTDIEKVTAEEKSESVIIIPNTVLSDSWESVDLARLHDLTEGAILQEFNTENSAFIVSKKYEDGSLGSDVADDSAESLKISPDQVYSADDVNDLGTDESIDNNSLDNSGYGSGLKGNNVDNPVDNPESLPDNSSSEFIIELIPDSDTEPAPDIDSGGDSSVQVLYDYIPSLENLSFVGDFLSKFLYSDARAQIESLDTDIASRSLERFLPCDREDSDCVARVIEFDGFGIGDAFLGKPPKNIQLRLSLAAEKIVNENNEVLGRILVEYSFKNVWSRAGEILMANEVSNAVNGGFFLYALPEIESWDELDDLKFRITAEYLKESDVRIYLDGIWLEVDADFSDSPMATDIIIVENLDYSDNGLDLLSSESFDSYEIPMFSFKYNKGNSPFYLLSSFLQSLIGRGGGFILKAVDQKINIEPSVTVDDKNFNIQFDNSRFFVPGRHKLKMKIEDGSDNYYYEHEYSLGSILVNIDKPVYKPGDIAKILIDVLDDSGNLLCNPEISVKITSSLQRISIFSTKNNEIQKSGKCLAGDRHTNSSFYFNYLIPLEEGHYSVEITAETANGTKLLSDSFEVAGDLPLRIERNLPARVIPGNEYSVVIDVFSSDNINGILTDIVPANFEIIPFVGVEEPEISIKEDGYSRVLSWPISVSAGNSARIRYSFKVLNSSKSVYNLGPVSFGDYSDGRYRHIFSEKGKRAIMINENVEHFCKVEPFSLAVGPDITAEYMVKLIPSKIDKHFLLSIPDIPPEINISLDKAVGDMAGNIVMKVSVNPDIARGSFNIPIIYQERELNGSIFGTSCQFNLVVE